MSTYPIGVKLVFFIQNKGGIGSRMVSNLLIIYNKVFSTIQKYWIRENIKGSIKDKKLVMYAIFINITNDIF